jgi:hypothetical protein
VAIWATLAEILSAAGLQVTAGCSIATETDKAFFKGNYVQGTVLLALRKRSGEERGHGRTKPAPSADAARRNEVCQRFRDRAARQNAAPGRAVFYAIATVPRPLF